WKERMLVRLEPLRKPFLDVFLQWTAACAAFVLLIRVLPFVFLPSMTQAGSVVSVLPSGEVHMTVAGITVPLEEGVELSHPALIRTLDGEATVILHDDAVLRLAPHTTIRLHDLTD